MLREGLRLIEQREAREAAKLQALRAAAGVGLADLEQGRYRDLNDDTLEEYVVGLGRQAEQLVRGGGR